MCESVLEDGMRGQCPARGLSSLREFDGGGRQLERAGHTHVDCGPDIHDERQDYRHDRMG
jgi:hypothetical protein